MIIPNNTSLIRVIINSKKSFYNQDWYYNQDFAYENISGVWDLEDTTRLLPAGVWVYAYNSNYHLPVVDSLAGRFVWTSSHDWNGDQVYVGCYRPNGLQIHRHLTIRPELFINPEGDKIC